MRGFPESCKNGTSWPARSPLSTKHQRGNHSTQKHQRGRAPKRWARKKPTPDNVQWAVSSRAKKVTRQTTYKLMTSTSGPDRPNEARGISYQTQNCCPKREISPLSSEGKEALGKNQGPTTDSGCSNDDPLVSGLSRLVMVRGGTKSGFIRVKGKIRVPVRSLIQGVG